MVRKLKLFCTFVGNKILWLSFINFVQGILWFCVEAGFLLVFQGFLLSIGFLDNQSFTLPSWYPRELTSNLIILTVYGLVRAILTGLNKMIPSLICQVFSAEQRKRLLYVSFFENQNVPTSEIVGAFGELSTKAGFFVQHCSTILGLGASLLLLFVFSLRLAMYEACLALILLFIVMLPFRRMNKRISVYGQKLVLDWNHANKVLVDGLKNIFLLRVYRLLNTEYEKGIDKIQSYENHYGRYVSVSTIVSSFPLFAGLLIIATVTYVSKTYLSTDPVNFVAFLYLFLRIAQTASTLSSSASNALFYKDSFLSLYAMTTKYKRAPESTPASLSEINDGTAIGIDFSTVTFSYSPGRPIFKDLNIKLSPGEFLLVKGPSGAGKSTLIKLLVGIIIPDSGKIKIANLDPLEFISSRAKDVGYVGPEPYLIPGSVRENLEYGNKNSITDEKIWEVLTALGLRETIQNFSQGLGEFLNEETQLSTGQKQRLSFARAILRSPKLMILDEATANIDQKTETLILDYLKQLNGKVTVVAISHRESFDGLASQLISMTIHE